MNITELIKKDKELNNFIEKAPVEKRSLLTGVNSGAFAAVLMQMLKVWQQPLILVEDNEEKAQTLLDELGNLLPDDMVFSFPVDATIATQTAIASPDELSQRLQTLEFLAEKRAGIVVVTPQALQYKLSDPRDFTKAKKIFKPEAEFDLDKLTEWLTQAGYRRESIVARPGEFARRGDILDIYPLDQENPIRIEFFGDEVDTVKEFDSATQRSLEEKDSISIGPALDRVFSPHNFQEAVEKIKQDMSESIAEEESVKNHFVKAIDLLEAGGLPDNYAFLIDYLLPRSFNLIDYLDKDGLLLFDDWQSIKKNVADVDAQNEAFISEEIKAGAMLNIQNLVDYGVDIPVVKADQLLSNKAQITVGNFAHGFALPSLDLVYLTERELFNQRPHHRKRVKTLENAQRLRNYNELKPGDYVVHVNHGIGRFEGIKTLDVDGKKRDYITITYQHHDQLFVPADQLGLVQKYVASEGRVPHINKLGSSEWTKTKKRVQSKVEDIADDLIELYAKRESEKGFAFSPDDDLQKEFEDAFPYPETPDQLRSIREIKADMESPKPMDRLLVGDVGFGKTEVALRAAFKAIRDGKQVAFLAPTTILAQQHFETMQDRFKDFPVNCALLSRFQTPAEVKEIVEGVKSGKIDMVVGTHRLLSKDVQFKDLGLLIIDEEQRFGVKHKERLKELKANIDVLTLTATPIPRTLHMSMVGVRDLSVMETPPTNRYPIQTYVMEEMPSIVREAVLREMKRNGQVFFLHNRIDDIDKVVSQLEELIPEAKIEYIHGRMSENQMEDIMYRFSKNEFDILVTTTIIETGVDMPNVNTMIVEDADHYGLSQLYQLRGRIGRSARLAYAYFLYQPNKVLTEIGEKRLSAIRDFTELGSGFKIAMRDLSIRGAGNMLGKQQHGFIDSVGYDLYAQMLDEAIKKRKGKKVVVKSNAEVQFNLEAYIPDDYIADQEQKIEFYKKIKGINDQKEADNIADELIDRFGDYPLAVENLLNVSTVKADADLAQVVSLTQKSNDKLQVIFNNQASEELEGPNIFKALEHVSLRARITMDPQKRLNVMLELEKNMSTRQLFNELHTFLEAASEIVQK